MKRGRPSFFNDNEAQFLAWLYEYGYSLKEIADRFNCGDFTIRNYLASAGCALREKRGRPRTDSQAFFMKWLYDYGYSLQEIGKKLGCTKQNVSAIFKSRNWEARSRGKKSQDEKALFSKWLYDYGYSFAEIGAKLETSSQAIYSLFVTRDWDRRPKIPANRNDSKANFMKWLYDYGFSLSQIAYKFGCAVNPIKVKFEIREWPRRPVGCNRTILLSGEAE